MNRQLRIKRDALPTAAAREQRMYKRGWSEGHEAGKLVGFQEGVGSTPSLTTPMTGANPQYSRRLNFSVEREITTRSIIFGVSVRVDTQTRSVPMMVQTRIPIEMLEDVNNSNPLHVFVTFIRDIAIFYPLYLAIEEFAYFMQGVIRSSISYDRREVWPDIFQNTDRCIKGLHNILGVPDNTYDDLYVDTRT